MFTWRCQVSALMPRPVSTAVCMMAGSTVAEGFYALFLVVGFFPG
jgi:hypothetical protein